MNVCVDATMIRFVKFDVLNATENEWKDFHQYRRKFHEEDTPEDPIMTDQAAVEDLKGQAAALKLEISLFAIKDEKIIGFFYYAFFSESSASYVGNEKVVFFNIDLLKKYRRQGIGSAALKKIVDSTAKENKSIFICDSHIQETKKFYSAIGAEIANPEVENRLKFSEINWSMVKAWIKEAETKNPETKIMTTDEGIPDYLWTAFAKTFTEVGRDEPKGSEQRGDFVFNEDELKKMDEADALGGTKTIRSLTIEKNGEVSSYTEIKIFPGKESLVNQAGTGVVMKYRGRKLGKWIKAKNLEFLKEKYPETEAIVTGNANSNEPMLYINNKLGFKPYKEKVSAQAFLEPLQNYLHSKTIREIPVIEK